MNNPEVQGLTNANAPTWEYEWGSKFPLFRFVKDKWRGKQIAADMTDSVFNDISFWYDSAKTEDAYIFDFKYDATYNYIGDLTLNNAQFTNLDCYECSDATPFFRLMNGYTDFSEANIDEINTNVYANSKTSNAHLFWLKLRPKYMDGATEINEKFILSDASVTNYQSRRRIFTIWYDGWKSPQNSVQDNFIITDTTFDNIATEWDAGGILYGNLHMQQAIMTDVTLTNIDGGNHGGAFYFHNTEKYELTRVSATDFTAAIGGSFLYHQITGIDVDPVIEITDGTFNCDSVTAFDWATVKNEVDTDVQTRGSVFEFEDTSGTNNAYTATLSGNDFSNCWTAAYGAAFYFNTDGGNTVFSDTGSTYK